MENIKKQKTPVSAQIINPKMENLWKRFKTVFWALFIFHLLLKGLPSIQTTEENVFTLFVISIVLNLLVVVAMIINVGLHSYLFSEKKIYAFLGLLGLWWAGFVGIFIAYFAVQWTYYQSLGKKFSLRERLVVGVLIIISLLFISVFLPSIID